MLTTSLLFSGYAYNFRVCGHPRKQRGILLTTEMVTVLNRKKTCTYVSLFVTLPVFSWLNHFARVRILLNFRPVYDYLF